MTPERTFIQTLSLAGEAASVWFVHNFLEPLRSRRLPLHPPVQRAVHYVRHLEGG